MGYLCELASRPIAKRISENRNQDKRRHPMSELSIVVNGTQQKLAVQEARTLAEVLRYDLGLTGTKIGCNEAECGICTVLVNGIPVDSCIYPAFKAQGAEIKTIEG